MTATPDTVPARPRFADTAAVYLKPRVLIVLFLGFASGLPLALSGSTLAVWMREAGVDLGTIGLFALVGTPYTIKFLWAPIVDALDAPVLSRLLGRRRGLRLGSPILIIAARLARALANPDDGGHRAARPVRSRARGVVRGVRRCAAGGDGIRHAGYSD